jgi:predicted nucleotidyltransferase
MHSIVESKRGDIVRLCRHIGVARLDIFGSATGDGFVLGTSDIDILVEFPNQPGFDHFNSYFELKEGLERIFNRRVDLVTLPSVKNPYLRHEIMRSREALYAA